MDPKLARFLARHAVSAREAVEQDVAELRGLSPEDSWRVVDSVCLSAADVLSMRPDRATVLSERDPPHPSYDAIMARLRAGYRNRRALPRSSSTPRGSPARSSFSSKHTA